MDKSSLEVEHNIIMWPHVCTQHADTGTELIFANSGASGGASALFCKRSRRKCRGLPVIKVGQVKFKCNKKEHIFVSGWEPGFIGFKQY